MSDFYWETIAWHEAHTPRFPPILEAYRGTEVVEWWGRIERQLVDMVNRFETSRDFESKSKAQEALDVWRKNQITGSINVETVNALESGIRMLAVDTWNQSNYFAALRDSLRKLVAGQEELPPMPDETGGMGGGGGGGGGGPNKPIVGGPEENPEEGGPEPSQDFGPEKEPGETPDQEGKAVPPEGEESAAPGRPRNPREAGNPLDRLLRGKR